MLSAPRRSDSLALDAARGNGMMHMSSIAKKYYTAVVLLLHRRWRHRRAGLSAPHPILPAATLSPRGRPPGKSGRRRSSLPVAHREAAAP